MDLVINHTSDQHEWFQKALKDPEGKYGNYYHFCKGKDGNPPTNYRSYFGGSTWEPVEGTDLYYLHAFAKEQPDLNWENPEVLAELYKMINWWLDKGIAGFRIDAIINIKKHPDLPNYAADGDDGLVKYTTMVENTEGIGELLRDLKENTFDKHGAFTVGEVFNVDEEGLKEFIGPDGYFTTMFDFTGEILSKGKHGWYDAPKWDFTKWRDKVFEAHEKIRGIGFYANVIENHDEPRGANRYLPKSLQNSKGIKMLAAVYLFLPGLPFIYQGQEIGMQNFTAKSIDEYDDINTIDEYKKAIAAGLTKEQALEVCNTHSRDNARTPMQWNESENAGFTTGKPWLKVNDNYKTINVESEKANPESVLNFYKEAIILHKEDNYKELFAKGELRACFTEYKEIFAYERVLGDKKVLIAANFGESAVEVEKDLGEGIILLTNENIDNAEKNKLRLSPGAIRVILEKE